MSVEPTTPTPTDQATSVPAPLDPSSHVTVAPVTAAVSVGEIAEFLRHLARFRSPAVGGDPADQAALLARKAELLTRIADQHAHAVTDPPSTAAPTTPTTPTTPEGRTP